MSTKSSGCEICDGKGEIPTRDKPGETKNFKRLVAAGVENPHLAYLDPYMKKRTGWLVADSQV